MLVPEMERTAAEMARVLRPGGRAVLAVWASSRVNPWMTAPGRAALELGLSDPPDLEAPGPFRLADPEQLRSVVESGGLEIQLVEDVPVTWEAASLAEWWDVVRDTSRMLTLLLERLSDEETTALRQASEAHLEEFAARDGSLTVPGVARIVQAVAPTHVSRPQRIVWPSALATRSTAVWAVRFARSRIGFDSTTSNEPTIPDSAISSQARCASR